MAKALVKNGKRVRRGRKAVTNASACIAKCCAPEQDTDCSDACSGTTCTDDMDVTISDLDVDRDSVCQMPTDITFSLNACQSGNASVYNDDTYTMSGGDCTIGCSPTLGARLCGAKCGGSTIVCSGIGLTGLTCRLDSSLAYWRLRVAIVYGANDHLVLYYRIPRYTDEDCPREGTYAYEGHDDPGSKYTVNDGGSAEVVFQ